MFIHHIAKDGHRYAIVPFRHLTGPSRANGSTKRSQRLRALQPLPRSVYRAALAQGRLEPSGPFAGPQKEGWATGQYAGVTKIMKPGRVRASGYYTFRTVSEGSPAASWVIRKAHEKRERDQREEELRLEGFGE